MQQSQYEKMVEEKLMSGVKEKISLNIDDELVLAELRYSKESSLPRVWDINIISPIKLFCKRVVKSGMMYGLGTRGKKLTFKDDFTKVEDSEINIYESVISDIKYFYLNREKIEKRQKEKILHNKVIDDKYKDELENIQKLIREKKRDFKEKKISEKEYKEFLKLKSDLNETIKFEKEKNGIKRDY